MCSVDIPDTSVARVGLGVLFDGLEDVPATMTPLHVSGRPP